MTEKNIHFRGSKLIVQEKLSHREIFRVWDANVRKKRLLSIHPDSADTKKRLKFWDRVDTLHSTLPKLIRTEKRNGNVYALSHWIDGKSLSSYLNRLREGRGKWISVYEAIRLFRGVVHGLSAMHGHGLIHGDISPANLLLQGPKPTRLVLIDCGSGYSTKDSSKAGLTSDGITPFYAAPEYYDDTLGNCSYLSDQFSLTVVFYEMLTGKLPFGGLGGKIGQYSNRRPGYVEPQRQLKDKNRYPRDAMRKLCDVVRQGLQYNPDCRFTQDGDWRASVDELWQAVQPTKTGSHRWLENGHVRNLIAWLAKKN